MRNVQLPECKVLVVEDDEMNRVLLQHMLARIGVLEVRVEAGADALDRVVAEFGPDVILMDRHLGQSDGLAALERLADADPAWSERRAVMVTGEVAQDVDARATAAGVVDVLVKPYTIGALEAVLAAALAS